MKYMLDTDICIRLMKKKLPVLERFGVERRNGIAVSSISLAELRFGVENSGSFIERTKAVGLTLVTGNLREFERVSGLAVENWAC